MKTCKVCGCEFKQGKHKRRTCAPCIYAKNKKYQKEYHKTYKEPNGTSRRKRYRQKQRDLVDNYKLERGCEHCGLKTPHPQVYDFHHLDPNEKEFTISSRIGNRGQQVMTEEMEKCLVLCANCHRLVHAGVINV